MILNTCFVVGTTVWLFLNGGNQYEYFMNTENVLSIYDYMDYGVMEVLQTSGTTGSLRYVYDDETQQWLSAKEIVKIMKSCEVSDAKN